MRVMHISSTPCTIPPNNTWNSVTGHADSLAALDPSASAGSAPDLIVNVTGSVLHGPHVLTGFGSDQARELAPKDHPRKFHEMFMLRAAEQGEGMQPKVCLKSYFC